MKPAFPERILITTDAVGGVWTYSLALAQGFAARGVPSTIAVLGPKPDAVQRADVKRVSLCDLITTDLPLEWHLTTSGEVRTLVIELQVLATSLGVTSIHLHTPALAALPWKLPVVAVVHSCMATWWDVVCDGKRPAEFEMHFRMSTAGLNHASAVIAPSQSFATLLSQTYEIAPPVQVIHNGLPRQRRRRKKRQKYVFSAGRLWDAGKNFSTLNAAARFLNCPVEIAGPSISPSGSELPLPNLQHLGTLSAASVRSKMENCAVFAACSRYEPFGLAVLEAAQLSTPLVLSDIPTFRELWSDAAVFVHSTREADWATAINSLLDDPEMQAQLGERAYVRSELYSQDLMTSSTVSIHQKLISDKLGQSRKAQLA